MERLEGLSLAQTIDAEGALAPTRVAFIAYQMLAALSAAHALGVIHRDLKPDNVFLTSVSGLRDIVKLLDFGIAKLVLQMFRALARWRERDSTAPPASVESKTAFAPTLLVPSAAPSAPSLDGQSSRRPRT